MSQGTAGWLDFEKPLVELEQKIAELRDLAAGQHLEAADELTKLLSRQANQARQAEITTEISEIVGGAEALTAG